MNMIFTRPLSSSTCHSTGDIFKQVEENRLLGKAVQIMNMQSQRIESKGEVAGEKMQQENSLEVQADNQKEYKKEKRHRILHAIFSFIAHIVSIVMIVVRPVKSVAKIVKKGIKKAIKKTAGKSLHKTAGHMMKKLGKGLKHAGKKGVKHVKSGVNTVKSTAVRTANNVRHMHGSIFKNLGQALKGTRNSYRNFMRTDLGRLAKREAIVNGTVDSVNGIGDGVTDLQIAKLKSHAEALDNHNKLIDQNFDVFEQQKKQSIENAKEIVQGRENMLHLQQAFLKSANDISTAFITHAA